MQTTFCRSCLHYIKCWSSFPSNATRCLLKFFTLRIIGFIRHLLRFFKKIFPCPMTAVSSIVHIIKCLKNLSRYPMKPLKQYCKELQQTQCCIRRWTVPICWTVKRYVGEYKAVYDQHTGIGCFCRGYCWIQCWGNLLFLNATEMCFQKVALCEYCCTYGEGCFHISVC